MSFPLLHPQSTSEGKNRGDPDWPIVFILLMLIPSDNNEACEACNDCEISVPVKEINPDA